MKRLFPLATFFLSFPVIAATQEEIAKAPPQTVDTVYVMIFLVVFIGALIGGCIYYFRGGSDENSQKK